MQPRRQDRGRRRRRWMNQTWEDLGWRRRGAAAGAPCPRGSTGSSFQARPCSSDVAGAGRTVREASAPAADSAAHASAGSSSSGRAPQSPVAPHLVRELVEVPLLFGLGSERRARLTAWETETHTQRPRQAFQSLTGRVLSPPLPSSARRRRNRERPLLPSVARAPAGSGGVGLVQSLVRSRQRSFSRAMRLRSWEKSVSARSVSWYPAGGGGRRGRSLVRGGAAGGGCLVRMRTDGVFAGPGDRSALLLAGTLLLLLNELW